MLHPNATATAFSTNVELRAAAIAYPESVADVIEAVRYARDRGLKVAPQATGHNLGAHASLEDTVLVDVQRLQDV